ncbi:MAG: cadherin-like domain-containing protein [candidate division Zixibacteria bacterium]|nr:cadherin-like domain-containing protein [candidate division Zixibacteria bacterium]
MRHKVLVLAILGVLGMSQTSLATLFNVSAAGMTFTPPTLTISVGDQVKWTLGGIGPHSVTSGTGSLDPQVGAIFDAPLDGAHTTFTFQFNTAGVYPYFCRVHEPFMEGTITVNTIPVARDTVVMTSENTSTGATLQAFDADGNPLTYAILSGPFHGTATGLNASTGSFTYNPAADYVGADSIRFRVNDGNINSNTATMRITVTSTCNCPMQGDINGDLSIDVFDVIGVIGIAFSGDPDPQDPQCPITRGDVNNDLVTDVFDVIYLIATAFSGGSNPVDPCVP